VLLWGAAVDSILMLGIVEIYIGTHSFWFYIKIFKITYKFERSFNLG